MFTTLFNESDVDHNLFVEQHVDYFDDNHIDDVDD